MLLCIIQDDHDLKERQINNMAAIYAGAFVTIVAAQGEHADAGLRGIQQGSTPRHLHQEIYSITRSYQFAKPLRHLVLGTTAWYRRGWTFQGRLRDGSG